MRRPPAALRALRDGCRELAPELREIALAVDAEPHAEERLRASSALRLLRVAGTPRRHRASEVPGWASPFTDSCLARVVANVELARGDVGVLNACAAPSLAGLTVDALGDRAQQDDFYGALARDEPWTFFGMTEADHGSDATALGSRLTPDGAGGFVLHGGKRYVANAARGGIGVVFARTGPTPLAIRAVVLRRPAPGFTGAPLEMLGLRGACLGSMAFDGVQVRGEQVLGRHLPASRRGLWGANRAFGVVRMQIAAQALGAGYAIRDEVRALRPGWDGHLALSARLDAAHALLLDLAAEADADPDDRRPPSLAKLHTAALAVEVGRWAESALSPGSLVEHPLLEKWCRDVMAFEFMDGTSHMLRLAVAPDAAPRREGP
ncbi:acyl-CoA dehydrogenase family protein [Streptomyces profundus]|uniref:acyl-CoA dehydrogenase family protein n=1 Tax=Streptomyces profundus TaxID=2867410 RepID=UPI001D16DCA0|nr:acyl-CoA dehydrogenase family protein [Streptomyces sp. MA3_2.13]UED82956.1 acyl-CoA/acyl-ACP dehydrogenase [Streptomyces sp. MA3_2.13]